MKTRNQIYKLKQFQESWRAEHQCLITEKHGGIEIKDTLLKEISNRNRFSEKAVKKLIKNTIDKGNSRVTYAMKYRYNFTVPKKDCEKLVGNEDADMDVTVGLVLDKYKHLNVKEVNCAWNYWI